MSFYCRRILQPLAYTATNLYCNRTSQQFDILSLEFNALKRIQRIDADKYNLVKCIERFGYRRKVFIVFEMLDQSLHDFMRKRDGSPLSMSEIKTISWQLLVALKGLKSIGLVHTDIKPDNIMLVDSKSQPLRVKLIDFGLSLKLDDLITGSIFQTMPYRAPEVRLGLPLNEAIDMWALGHILTLLLTGSSLYPCDNDFNIIRAMVRMQGMPDSSLLEKYEKGVWELDSPVEYAKKTGKKLKLNIKQVELFVNLLEQMLLIDPDRRITVEEALKHPFFAENNDDNKRIGEKVSGIAYTAPAQDCIHNQRSQVKLALKHGRTKRMRRQENFKIWKDTCASPHVQFTFIVRRCLFFF
uniref:Protein kinase domain-containing protein n=1 Tax=Oryzias melastigma TaxID=30732 RepID=A0A3B3CJR1_ORYME